MTDISIGDEVQRHTQAPQGHHHSQSQPHTHSHNGRPCTGHHAPQNQNQQSQRQGTHTQYFRMLKESFSKNRVFFWNEFLSGGVLDEAFRRYSVLSYFKCLRSNQLQKFASTVLGFATQFLPNVLKPFFAGFFIPLVIFLYVNWKLLNLRVFPSLEESSPLPLITSTLFISIILLFVLTAVIGPGTLATDTNKQKTTTLITQKPYMNNPRVVCANCQVIKGFRSQHCPNCKQCIPKFSQHSPVFNRCIGASNQLFYFLFNLAIVIGEAVVMYLFTAKAPQDMQLSTKVIVILLNNYMQWMALVETVKTFILNFWYNLTENQVKNWMTAPYLIAFGKRQFSNPLNIGLINNLHESIYAIFGCQQSQQPSLITGSIIQPTAHSSSSPYITNWNKVMYSNGAELRNHPHRREITMKTKQMESFIVLQTQIMNRVRQEVLSEQRGKRPIQEINQIIMMQTQMELQKEMQKIMMQKMGGGVGVGMGMGMGREEREKGREQEKKGQSDFKGEQNERLIEDKEQQETREINLTSVSQQQLI